ncbi:MAG: hypothetical protein LBI79_07620 [Nitrososphaerota archaeon]|nr:hypothetical protein [Nitrososphaerota archaeon]
MQSLTLRVPRSEETELMKRLDEGKVQYKADNQKGFLPLEVLEFTITVAGAVIVALVTYLESRTAPSEIIIETPDGELALTADNIKKLRLNFKKS